ncbi:LysM peptidoglycan-binding domain-containing protein [bacterium LRH843]|nr:LysM peptidoglycan-binding domain-containing protein [bacterium LRH843]
MTFHVVQPGDTLWKVSQTYNVPVDSIVDVNGLRGTALIPGLALYLPQPSFNVHFHQIAAGDTLWSLAKRFQSSVEHILTANHPLDPYNLQIGKMINIPTPLKMKMTTLGFYVPYSPDEFHQQFPDFADELTYLAVVSYSFQEDGSVYVDLPDDGIPKTSLEHNVVPLLMIRNIKEGGKFSPELVGEVLEDPVKRRKLIDDLIDLIAEKQYGGVSIDFEFIPPKRREDFITFLKELKRALGGLVLHVNVHAKTEDVLTNPIIGGYDYAAIGEVADFVAVMTMDFGYPGGPPNPVTPIDWLEKVIRYSAGLIDRRKLQVALPLYGYDWIAGTTESSGLSLLAAQNLAISNNTSIKFNKEFMTPYFNYRKEDKDHIVWFDDIQSYAKKLQLIDYYRLNGVTFWETRLPFPQNWAFIRQQMNVTKYQTKVE